MLSLRRKRFNKTPDNAQFGIFDQCCHYHNPSLPIGYLSLVRLREVALSASLTRGFNGPLILSSFYPSMTWCKINIFTCTVSYLTMTGDHPTPSCPTQPVSAPWSYTPSTPCLHKSWRRSEDWWEVVLGWGQLEDQRVILDSCQTNHPPPPPISAKDIHSKSTTPSPHYLVAGRLNGNIGILPDNTSPISAKYIYYTHPVLHLLLPRSYWAARQPAVPSLLFANNFHFTHTRTKIPMVLLGCLKTPLKTLENHATREIVNKNCCVWL